MIASNITAAPLAHLGPQVPPAHSAAGLVAVAAQCAGPSYGLGGRAHTRFKKRPPCLRTPVHFDAGPNSPHLGGGKMDRAFANLYGLDRFLVTSKRLKLLTINN